VPGDGEHRLAVQQLAGAHAQAAEDAAVVVQQHVGVGGIHRPVGIELLEVRAGHLVLVGRGLQQAVAAAFAGRAEVVALDEEHLQQGAALGLQGGRLALHHRARRGQRGAGRDRAAVEVHHAQAAGAMGRQARVPAQVGM
jgi:hydrogenase maturation factor